MRPPGFFDGISYLFASQVPLPAELEKLSAFNSDCGADERVYRLTPSLDSDRIIARPGYAAEERFQPTTLYLLVLGLSALAPW